MVQLDELLRIVVATNASDLELAVSEVPSIRMQGRWVSLSGYTATTKSEVELYCRTVLPRNGLEYIISEKDVDFVHVDSRFGRFRGHVYLQKGTIAMSLRRIPLEAPDIESLCLPSICKTLVGAKSGLIVIGGSTGSGKSTTLAALVGQLNKSEGLRIVTIEDPVEFVFKNEKCFIVQREVGSDTESFDTALRSSLRLNPDVVVIGELREPESIREAIGMATTGHLVLCTLHANDTIGVLERLAECESDYSYNAGLARLARTLQGVVFQHLIKRADGWGMIPACEVLLMTNEVRKFIAGGKLSQIRKSIKKGDRYGMQTLLQSLQALLRTGMISSVEYETNCKKLGLRPRRTLKALSWSR